MKKKFKMDSVAGNLSEDIKADYVMKITIGSKIYYVAVPAMTC